MKSYPINHETIFGVMGKFNYLIAHVENNKVEALLQKGDDNNELCN